MYFMGHGMYVLQQERQPGVLGVMRHTNWLGAVTSWGSALWLTQAGVCSVGVGPAVCRPLPQGRHAVIAHYWFLNAVCAVPLWRPLLGTAVALANTCPMGMCWHARTLTLFQLQHGVQAWGGQGPCGCFSCLFPTRRQGQLSKGW